MFSTYLERNFTEARGRRGTALGKAEIENEDHNRKRLAGKTGKTSNRVVRDVGAVEFS